MRLDARASGPARLIVSSIFVCFFVIFACTDAAPPETRSPPPVGKLVYTITHGNEPEHRSPPSRASPATTPTTTTTTVAPPQFSSENNPISMITDFMKENNMMQTVMKLIDSLTGSALQQNTLEQLPVKPVVARMTQGNGIETFGKMQRDSVPHLSVGPKAKMFGAPVRVFHSTDERGVHHIQKDVVPPPSMPVAPVNPVSATVDATTKSIKNEQWTNTLFGPKGLFTAIFHAVDDRNKAGASKGETIQSDMPTKFDFAKIFDMLLLNSQKGDFDEPIPELPEFLGICNRLSCGDIFKAIDQFKKSEFFSNFQTALQLIQDPKGWDIIGEVISNPELIANFAGGSMPELGKIFGSALGKPEGETGGSSKENKSKHKPGKSFLEMKVAKPNAIQLPEIAENVDAGGMRITTQRDTIHCAIAANYKNVNRKVPIAQLVTVLSKTLKVMGSKPANCVVNSGGDEDLELIEKEEKVETVPATILTTPKPTPINERMELPEISESIDGPEEETDGMETFTVDEKIDRAISPPKEKKPAFQRRFVTVETTAMPLRTAPSRRTRVTTTTTRRPIVITTKKPKTTTKNFRKEDDYYSMYYDS
ncbi:hypothetical protein L596_020727 [Steinernema carpocapsae]|uniref:Uncharacterized protein n=1 Tax=Steinernema carpocapsae TaxID=34508 RepID=A0A4U5MUL3_STECR|nr:hypothetical protein L596_020727 [Steinernema carpocapsae]